MRFAFDGEKFTLHTGYSPRYIQESARFGKTIDYYSEGIAGIHHEMMMTNVQSILNKAVKKSKRFAKFINDIEIGIIADFMPNAFAWTAKDGSNFIAINFGLIAYITYINFYIYSHKDSIPFGDDTEESPIVGEELRKTFKISDIFVQYNERGILFDSCRIMPKGESRFLFANQSITYACAFVILHEIGHLFYRHCMFLNKYYGMPYVCEIDDPAQDGLPNDTRQFFEFQADHFAITCVLKWGLPKILSTKVKGKGYEAWASSHALWSSAVEMVLWTFAQNKKYSERNKNSTHPHALLRSYAKAVTAGRYYTIKNSYRRFHPDRRLGAIGYGSMVLYNFWKKNCIDGLEGVWIEAENRDEQIKSVAELLKRVSQIRLLHELDIDMHVHRELFPEWTLDSD